MTKRYFLTLFLILFGVLLAGRVSADSGPLFNDGVVQGRITDANGNGIPNIRLYFKLDNAFLSGSNHSQYDIPLTDETGYFRIENLPRGSYIVLISDSYTRYATRYYGGTRQSVSATRISITGSTPLELNETLFRGSAITGKVIKPADIEHFSPTIELLYYDTALEGFYDVRIKSQSEDGSFQFYALAEEGYFIAASTRRSNYFVGYSGGAPSLELAEPITPEVGKATDVQIILHRPEVAKGKIGGRVISAETGDPMPNIELELYFYNQTFSYWSHAFSVRSDWHGNYTFAGLTGGSYKIGYEPYQSKYLDQYNNGSSTLDAAPAISLAKDEQYTTDFALEIGGSITIPVNKLQGQAANNGTIHGFRWSAETGTFREAAFDSFFWNRGFYLEGLPSGRYKFRLVAEFPGDQVHGDVFREWYGDAVDLESAAEVIIQAGQAIIVEPATFGEQTGRIFGRIIDSNGNPVSNTQVNILRTSADRRFHSNAYETKTNWKGEFTIKSVQPDIYYAYVSAPDKDHAMTFYGHAPDEVTATPFQIIGQDSAEINIQLQQAGAISGQLTTPSWLALDFQYAALYRKIADEWVSIYESDQKVELNSAFRFDSLWPGEYTIRFSGVKYSAGNAPSTFYVEYAGDVANLADATTILVTAGEVTSGINAELGNFIKVKPTGTIKGTVLSILGESSAGFEVYIYQRQRSHRGSIKWIEAAMTIVQADGSYQFDSLEHGGYRIGFYDRGQVHKGEYYNNVADFAAATILEIDADNLLYENVDAILQGNNIH